MKLFKKKRKQHDDSLYESRDDQFMDIDRMVNEGLGGGHVTDENGLIEQSTTDTMDNQEFVIRKPKK